MDGCWLEVGQGDDMNEQKGEKVSSFLQIWVFQMLYFML
jgi:hypothetical protein